MKIKISIIGNKYTTQMSIPKEFTRTPLSIEFGTDTGDMVDINWKAQFRRIEQ